MKSSIVLIVAWIAFATASTSFASEWSKLKTPRGSEIEVTVQTAQGLGAAPVILVAPGQGCNSRGAIFETLGSQGSAAGYTVVRFEWAYCALPKEKQNPSPDLQLEEEDFRTALAYARALSGVDLSQIVLSGKSLGSLVAYRVFHAESGVRGLALLTPVCSYTTDDNDQPLPEPKRVGEENYPGLKAESRPVNLTLGSHDDLCLLPILYDFLRDSKGNITTVIVGGGHSLTVGSRDNPQDQERSQRNTATAISATLNWANLVLGR